MSRLLVDTYYNDLARLRQVTGSITEAVVSDAWKAVQQFKRDLSAVLGRCAT